ncbi:MAG: hypothetical protein B6U88_02165 [Candidatus Aenigmarchaeota archaeon ex4484_56]|nr:MAG: hypothetical protein B6U88_02165 [Candidatus Aenigmarchaeota archaeon ex4484_56]
MKMLKIFLLVFLISIILFSGCINQSNQTELKDQQLTLQSNQVEDIAINEIEKEMDIIDNMSVEEIEKEIYE